LKKRQFSISDWFKIIPPQIHAHEILNRRHILTLYKLFMRALPENLD